MPTKLFKPGNQLAKLGGSAKRENGVIQKARAWIRENGVERAIEWVNGNNPANARFALGLLFTYALGKPKETIEVNTTFEAIMSIQNDPRLDELIDGFAKWNVARATRSDQSGIVGQGQAQVQAPANSGSSV